MKKLLWLLPIIGAFILLNQSCSTESTPVYQLTTSAQPSEAGSVSQSAQEADEGESITITAEANEHWVFNGWSGDHSGSDNPSSVVMDQDKSVTAMFQKRDYPLTIEIDGEGSVDERVIAQKTNEHPYGTIVELTAIPDEGWTFIQWSGDYEGKDKTIEVTVDGPVMISVVFEQVEHRYEGGEQEFEATSSGEIVVIAPVDNPDYEQVNFDFNITYDDESETPVEGARVVVDQSGDIFWIRIEGLGEDDGRVLIAGTPDEILEMLQEGVNKQHYGHITIEQDSNIIISGALIIGAAIKIYKAYKIYKSARAIWDLAFDAYIITAHFSDGVRAADGGRLFCKPLTEVEDLANDLQSLAISSGRFVISVALPKADVNDGFMLLEAVANDVGQTLDTKIADYLADLIIDQAFQHAGVEGIFGVRLYYPWDLDISDDEGRKPGFIQVIPNDPECEIKYETVTDIDGNEYRTVKIGEQIWMAENLNTGTYKNGNNIPNVTNNDEWNILKTGAWSYYENDPSNSQNYGKLYNFYAVEDARGLCPKGWKVPSEDDWVELEMHLGMNEHETHNWGKRGDAQNVGGKLKKGGTNYWRSPNLGATNNSGFSALPGGSRGIDGTYIDINFGGYWWTTSLDKTHHNPDWGFYWLRYLYSSSKGILRGSFNKESGLSVRCIQN